MIGKHTKFQFYLKKIPWKQPTGMTMNKSSRNKKQNYRIKKYAYWKSLSMLKGNKVK